MHCSTEELTLKVKPHHSNQEKTIAIIAREVNGCVIYRAKDSKSKKLYWSLSDFAMKEKVTILKVDDSSNLQ